ncbi:MAG TPA: hypothetical protein VGJ21_11855 [Terracidiphilus sp.]
MNGQLPLHAATLRTSWGGPAPQQIVQRVHGVNVLPGTQAGA